jgi:hypothetical protein
MRTLYKFRAIDPSDTFSPITGVFVERSSSVHCIQKKLCFGRASDPAKWMYTIDLSESNFTALSTDQDFIDKFLELELSHGHNPFIVHEPIAYFCRSCYL